MPRGCGRNTKRLRSPNGQAQFAGLACGCGKLASPCVRCSTGRLRGCTKIGPEKSKMRDHALPQYIECITGPEWRIVEEKRVKELVSVCEILLTSGFAFYSYTRSFRNWPFILFLFQWLSISSFFVSRRVAGRNRCIRLLVGSAAQRQSRELRRWQTRRKYGSAGHSYRA